MSIYVTPAVVSFLTPRVVSYSAHLDSYFHPISQAKEGGKERGAAPLSFPPSWSWLLGCKNEHKWALYDTMCGVKSDTTAGVIYAHFANNFEPSWCYLIFLITWLCLSGLEGKSGLMAASSPLLGQIMSFTGNIVCRCLQPLRINIGPFIALCLS